MISERRSEIFKACIFSLFAAFLLPLSVYAQTDVPFSSSSDEQIEYGSMDLSDELVGQTGTDIEVRAESGARATIHEALKQHANSIDVSAYGLTYDEARALLRDVIYWDGSLFYAEPYVSMRLVNDHVTYIYPEYIEHEKEIENVLKRVVREYITQDMSDLQKMIALHNWLAANCTYDYSYEKSTVYDALVTGSAVCQGYKDAYEMLLRYVGIVEVGTARGGNHTWNQVKVNGQWYNIDVTWDSNQIENGPLGQMYYGNFMISDSQLVKNDHTIESQDHECTSTLYDKGGWWNAGGRTVYSAAVPVNGAGSYRLGYNRPNMSLIYRSETTGTEKTVHVFNNAAWGYRSGSHYSYYANCYGVLIRYGTNIFVNDTKSVYLITNDGNVSEIYTYNNEDGRCIFGMRERYGNLELQIGYEPYVSTSQIIKISLESYEDDSEVKMIKDFVRRMYRITLGREAETEGLNYYVTGLQNGTMDGSTVAQGFVLSPEFQGKKLNADDYMIALYSAFFNRTPASNEINYWKDKMASGMSRKYVLQGFVNSPEFERLCQDAGIDRGLMVLGEGEEYEINTEKLGDFVERLYVKALGREAEPAGKEYWIEQISTRKATAEEAAKRFFFSPEFESYRTSNAEYIERLYQTFMGRHSEADGMNYWLDKINRGMSREVVLSSFAASPEFKEIMEEFGIR